MRSTILLLVIVCGSAAMSAKADDQVASADGFLTHSLLVSSDPANLAFNDGLCIVADEPRLLVSRYDRLFCCDLTSRAQWEVRIPNNEVIPAISTDELGRVVVVGTAQQGVIIVDRESLTSKSRQLKGERNWRLDGKVVHCVRRSDAAHMIAAATQGGPVYIIDERSGEEFRHRIDVARPGATILEFLNSGQLLAIGTFDGTVEIYDTATAELRARLAAPRSSNLLRSEEGVGAIVEDSLHRHVAILSRGRLDVYRMTSYAHVYRVSLPDADPWYVASDPVRKQWCVMGSTPATEEEKQESSVFLVKGDTGAVVTQVALSQRGAGMIATSADGRWLAVSGPSEINVWRLGEP